MREGKTGTRAGSEGSDGAKRTAVREKGNEGKREGKLQLLL